MCFMGKKTNLNLDLESPESDFTPCFSCDHQEFDIGGHKIDAELLLFLEIQEKQ